MGVLSFLKSSHKTVFSDKCKQLNIEMHVCTYSVKGLLKAFIVLMTTRTSLSNASV